MNNLDCLTMSDGLLSLGWGYFITVDYCFINTTQVKVPCYIFKGSHTTADKDKKRNGLLMKSHFLKK